MANNDHTESGINAAPCQPVTPQSLVTEEHVRATLSADKGAAATLTAWKVVDFTKKGDNYACVVTSIHVDYILDNQSSKVVYVAKINPCRVSKPEDDFNDALFESETKFYSILAPKLNSVLRENGHREINCPKCFHTSLESGKEIIFLEDLRAKGYKMFDRTRGLDEAHATLVIRELARLHAASLLLQANTPQQTLKQIYPFLGKNFYYHLKRYGVVKKLIQDSIISAKDIMNKLGKYDRVTAWMDSIYPKLEDIFHDQTECGEPKMLLHGDCWNNNILFRYNEEDQPEEVMLIDLQIVNYGTPGQDINYLFFTSMTGDVRKRNTENFLDTYYATFKKILEDAGREAPFTRMHLGQNYKDKNLLGLIFAIMVVPIVLFESDTQVDSSKDGDEDLEKILTDARKKSMANLDTNPLIRPRFLSVFEEMMEAGVIP